MKSKAVISVMLLTGLIVVGGTVIHGYLISRPAKAKQSTPSSEAISFDRSKTPLRRHRPPFMVEERHLFIGSSNPHSAQELHDLRVARRRELSKSAKIPIASAPDSALIKRSRDDVAKGLALVTQDEKLRLSLLPMR